MMNLLEAQLTIYILEAELMANHEELVKLRGKILELEVMVNVHSEEAATLRAALMGRLDAVNAKELMAKEETIRQLINVDILKQMLREKEDEINDLKSNKGLKKCGYYIEKLKKYYTDILKRYFSRQK